MNRNVTISKRNIESIIGCAYDAYPEECCGLMFSRSVAGDPLTVDAYSEMTQETNTSDHYAMDPFELTAKENSFRKRGYEIAGFYHSHPDSAASLSDEDEQLMIPGMVYLVISLMHGRCSGFSAWIKDSSESAPVRMWIRERA
ncbi:MAG: M67 family metallopeptidase [Lachnospiraceae bacterium]|nr:M67 family metallopeptidase [Lachnospiraceae bacterium]